MHTNRNMPANDATPRTHQLAALAALIALGLATPATAQLTCNSLYSLATGGGAACADAALDALYANPVVGSTGAGPLLGLFAPQCEDGTNNCPDEEVRCMDGTRPIYYVDPAEDANGEPMVSNGWVFFVTGGGSCSSALTCGQNYFGTERGEMTSASATRFRSEAGIFSNDPAEINLFRHYNRIYMRKCTYDRFTGNNTYSQVEVTPTPDEVDLFLHGRRMWNAVFEDLRGAGAIGKKYYTGACVTPDCDNSCPPATTCDYLPPLANATNIVLIGWSGGGTGMIHQLDDLSDTLGAIAPSADVRGVIDARFSPSVEVQSSFWLDFNVDGLNDYVQAGSPVFIDANGNGAVEFPEAINAPFGIYDGMFNEPGELPLTPGCGGCGQTYSIGMFNAPFGRAWISQDFHGTEQDASCEDVHGVDAPECVDHMHTLFNHVETPFFVRTGLRDNVYWGPGSNALGADDPAYFYRENPLGERVKMQVHTFLTEYATRSELALGIDDSWNGGLPAAPPFAIAAFAPDSTLHAGTIENTPFFDTCLLPPGGAAGDEVNLHFALFDWITWDTPIAAHESGLATGWTPVPAALCP